MVVIKNDVFPLQSKYKNYFDWYNFELSDFQKHSIQAIVDGNHTLVTAHTGSGKTIPAEFAIKYFNTQNPSKRVIYTSPIKALSNQKFYEFSQKFPEISFGIITGDIKFNPDADVLIMTTEILENCCRNNNQNITLDFSSIGAVIFDEVHYINDLERGKVWEHTILYLQPHIQLIMLSATIDEPEQFAEWIENRYNGELEQKKVILTSTNKRVVPLIHYNFITTNETVFKTLCKGNKELEKDIRNNTNCFKLLQNERGEFQENTFYDIRRIKKTLDNVKISRQHVLNQLVIKLRNEDMMPAIMFVFSRKMVEQYAKEITTNLFMSPLIEPDISTKMDIYDDSKIPYIISRECEQLLRSKLTNYTEYLELPEYKQLISLLEKGIAIHHSGMLPILREIVEFMISKKYVKLLFATESFAIGLDCPIKTAVFTSLTKFDGNTQRYIFSHEYSQMSGRAGRRGMDKIGYIIHCNNMFNNPTITEYKQIMMGNPQKLYSKFCINYDLILKNIIENENIIDINKIEDFIKKSILYKEICNQNIQTNRNINNLKELIYNKNKIIELYQNTPLDICIKYIDVENTINKVLNKKRREKEREKTMLEDNYKNIKKDVKFVNELLKLELELKKEEETYNYYENIFLKKQITNIINILIKLNYIEDDKLNFYGKMAIGLGEINSVFFKNIYNNIIKLNNVEEIICFLSVYCEWGTSSQFQNINETEQSEDNYEYIQKFYKKYVLEKDNLCETIINYEKDFSIEYCCNFQKNECIYYIIKLIIEWIKIDNAIDCKLFLSNLKIEIGEWNKILLKIVNLSRELYNIMENNDNNLEIRQILNTIPNLLLKFIVCNESLYI